MKAYRKAAKMTVRALSSAVGTTEVTISRYETGKRKMSVGMAKKIADVLKVDWWKLYDE